MTIREIPAAIGVADKGAKRTLDALVIAVNTMLGYTGKAEDHAALKGALRNAGIIGLNGSAIYDPTVSEPEPFDETDTDIPDAPSALEATTTAVMAFLSWTVPPFQPILSHAEVWELAAPGFREDIDYAVGDFVTYSSAVYKCSVAHSAAVWDAADFTAVTALDLVPANANARRQSSTTSANVPIDAGGTTYFWIRLISASGVAGDFSSFIAVEAESKSIPGSFPVGGEISSQASPGASWLEMNGQTVNRADYAELWSWADGASIAQVEAGKTAGQYGDGNGTTTFSLPDYRGRVLVGMSAAGTFSTIGAVGGAETVTLDVTMIPAHSHAVTDPGHTHAVTDPGHDHSVTDAGHSHNGVADTASNGTSGADAVGATAGSTDSATTGVTVDSNTTGVTVDSNTTGITTQNAGGGAAHSNVQPYAVTRFWVRAKL